MENTELENIPKQKLFESVNSLINSTNSLPVNTSRVPPNSVDLERFILGSILLESEALARIIDILKPEMFYDPKNQFIFEAATALFTRSNPVDLLAVVQYLRSTGKLEKAGGTTYINELTFSIGSSSNIEYHARIVVEKFIQRKLISITAELNQLAYQEQLDIFELLDKSEQKLFELSETNLRRDYLPMQDLVGRVLSRLEQLKDQKEGLTGITSGFPALDSYTSGWQNSDLIIIAARPGMGKTAFVLSVARNAAFQQNAAVAIFSLEMSATQLVQRLMFAEAEIDANKGRTGKLEPHEWIQLNERLNTLAKTKIFIDDTPGLSILELRAKCRRLKVEHNIQMIIIDYLQLMNSDAFKRFSREQEIAGISRALKELAKELDVPVIALSQLSREVEKRGSDKRPMLSDLRESGSIEQDADMVMFLYRPEYYGLQTFEDGSPTAGVGEVIIGKQRSGPLATVKLSFIAKFAKFDNLNEYFTLQTDPQFNNPFPIQPKNNPANREFPSKINNAEEISGYFEEPPF